MADPGYVTIPLNTAAVDVNPANSGSSSSGPAPVAVNGSPRRSVAPADRWKFGRSADKKFLSPVAVSKIIYKMMERIAHGSVGTANEFRLLPFKMESNRSPIIVELDRSMHSCSSTSGAALRVNLIPSCAVCDTGDNLPPAGTITYVIARPYQHDADPRSETRWRLSTVDRETRILDWADKADRGTRRKAIRILKALVKVEPQLEGLSSFHVRTASLYAFDRVVDNAPCWQRQSTLSAFIDALTELNRLLADGCMPHFFFRQLDLLAGVPVHNIHMWRSRIQHLVENHVELVRVLRRRTENRLVAMTSASATAVSDATF